MQFILKSLFIMLQQLISFIQLQDLYYITSIELKAKLVRI